jgi:hypothetical protein
LCSLLNVTDTFKRTDTLKFCILIIKFLYGRRKNKRLSINGSKNSQNLICSWFLHECSFDLLEMFGNIWNLTQILRSLLAILCYVIGLQPGNKTRTYNLLRLLCIYL